MISDDDVNVFLSALSDVLAEERDKGGLSLNQLAQRSGLNRQTLRFIEKKDHKPTCATLFRISIALETPIWKIVKQAEAAAKPSGK